MAPITILTGIVLIAVGVAGYFGTGTASVTALIPAFIGLPIALLGGLALRDGLRKHAMHLAAMLGLLGAIGAGVMGLPKLVPLMNGEAERPAAVLSQCVTALVCAFFVAACVNSFIQARRRRRAAEAGPAA